ncbi:MAG: GtrA family protein [Candidatus Lokiarchaeota archaeon]|nr:GtrA family protein [Candidatus Lokiarchaeota archaeon]
MTSHMAHKSEMHSYVQITLYLVFAGGMIALNYFIQFFNISVVAPWVESRWGHILIINGLYLSQTPINMTEFVGSIIAVGITYLIKFFLDKFIVFKNRDATLKTTSKQFLIYFVLAVFTTLENVGIQLLFTNVFGTPLVVSVITALSAGYITKYFLDKRFVFPNTTLNQKEQPKVDPNNQTIT